MSKIPLTQGFFAIIDDCDYEQISKYKWHTFKSGKYAASHIGNKGSDGKKKQVTMHRFIMGLSEGNKIQVDHINGNGLDNRRCNLRLCNNQQNHFNISKSNRKGACFVRGKWQSHITLNGKNIYLGRFKTKELATMAYDKKAKELFGEFARTNL